MNHLFDCKIGLEKESLRIDKSGRLAQTRHPFLGNPNIDRDFCENQVEIITNPAGSPHDAYLEIKKLHQYVIKELSRQGEYLWLFSNPPYFENDDEIPVAHFTGSLSYKEKYRRYLATKYGKRKMLYSGIHYNFSFGENLLKELFKNSGEKDYFTFVNSLYLHLAKWVVRYSWLIVFLTAASPLLDESFFVNEKDKPLNRYASARCSEIGYNNHFIPVIDYNNLSSYIKSIEHYVENGDIIVPSELYYPVRLKSSSVNSLVTLGETGVNHIELRMLDLNPLSEAGIFEEDIAFIHLLLLYLSNQQDFEFTNEMQTEAVKKMYCASLYDNDGFADEAAAIIDKIKNYFKGSLPEYYEKALTYQSEKIANSEKRYAVKIRKQFGNNFSLKGFELSKQTTDLLIKRARTNDS